MSIEIDSLEDLDDQGQDESSSEYYSPQLESTSTFTPNFTAATETALSTPDSFNLGTTSLRCKCGALISYDDLISRGTIPSHDISNSGYHLELGEWLCDLTKAIDAAWPKRHITYSDVHVLIITWEETDMRGMENEIKRLSSVFSDVFGYNIHRLIIPTSKADLRVRREVDSFIEEYGQQENLLIVYYAGHARPGLRTGSPPIWYPKKPTAGEPGASFDTNNILPILARAQDDSPDVLLIYDCCHSLSSHSINDEPSRAIVECLFAGGFETKVPIAGLDSFTHALYDELFIASKSSMPLSVTDLHRKIIDRLQNWIPHGVFNRDGTILRDNKTKEPVITQPVRTTPIHMFLSENEEPRTIFLAPNKQQRPETPNDDDSKNGEDELPRVLLAIRLVENDCNSEALKSFKKWILDAPQCVVKFEKLYQSYSELLLVEMPLQVWDLLPRNPAVTFIGFTKGEKPIEMLTTNVDGTPAAIGNPVIVSHKFESLGEDSSVETQPQSDNQMAHQTFAGTQLINLVDRPDSHMYHSERKEHRGLNTVLGAVDQILPKTFTDLEKSAKQNGLQLKILFDQVLENLVKLEVPGEEEIMSRDDILRYEAFLFQYVSAKHLIRYGPPWLNVENRLTGPMARLYDWYNDDIRAGSASIPEIPEIGENETSSEPSTNHSKLWSNPSIGGRSSAILSSMQESTPDISMAPSPQNKPLDNVGEPAAWSVKDKGEDQVKTSSNEAPNLEENLDNWIAHSRTTETSKPGVQNSDIGTTTQKIPEIDDTLQSTPYQSLEDEYLTQDTSTALVTRSESEQSLPIATRDKVVSFDTQPQYLPEDSESESESESSVLSGSTPSVSGYEIHDGAESEVNYPTIKSRHAAIDDLTETASVKSFAYPAIPTERVDVGDPRSFLDARYQVHKQSEFQFGRVFKILWSEKTDAKTLGVKYRSASKFYVGFRRFIIVATEKEGHSTCVPILTYERRGCTKTGVNPKTHGIVYSVSGNPGEREPRLLKGEPELGFPPIKVDGYKDDEPLPKESRVNYAKLITIEHNVKVFFIGFIPKLDFDKVIRATNECWVNNMRGRR